MDMMGPPDYRLSLCRALIIERKIANEVIGPLVCANPVWDMLLDLYVADREGRSTYIWPLSVAGNVPISSAHRKIEIMVRNGMVLRTVDESDRRRVGIQLSPSFRQKLESLFDRLIQMLGVTCHPGSPAPAPNPI